MPVSSTLLSSEEFDFSVTHTFKERRYLLRAGGMPVSSTLQDRLRNTIRDLHETIRESENDKCNFAIISNGRRIGYVTLSVIYTRQYVKVRMINVILP
ncbi:hypothetical protein QE152_g34077 [Popillia japonica]|uniref:Uncharacterized protein n=1 Tax=Popillia japonica TaxID=7064 RepID=A0AAW1IUU3_POPJA